LSSQRDAPFAFSSQRHARWPPPRCRDAEEFLAVHREELSAAHGNGIYHDAAAVALERRLGIEIDGDS
jgi:hypothetical protein